MNNVLALVACLCIGAMATPINISGSNGEQTLQKILDSLTVTPSPNPSISSCNVLTDQLVNDEVWTSTASGGSIATLVLEIAGNASTNSFGIYDLGSNASLEIFSGSKTGGSQSTLKFYDDGKITVSDDNVGKYGEAIFTSNNFGFYLGTANNGTFYSQVGKNADGTDHMVAFQGKNIDYLKIAPFNAGIWDSNEYILAWEDLLSTNPGFDWDYNDFVVFVESVRPTQVPEPASLSFIGIGLVTMLGSGWLKRKRS
jgi:hypothetical protein